MKNEFHVYEAYSSTPNFQFQDENLHYYLRLHLHPWPRLSTSTGINGRIEE
jgi:hypothetical protein